MVYHWYNIFISLVVLEQLEKYYRFTFKEKTPRFLFPALKTWHSINLFISALVVLVVTVTNDDSHGRLFFFTRIILIEISFLYVSICVLFQRCFIFLKRNVREAALNASSKVQKKKLGTSIKQLHKLQVANFLPGGILITMGLLSAMIPVLFRVHYLSACCTNILVQSSMVTMQLDFFRRSYLKQKEKLARTLKELERRGLKLESKFAKIIKAYAPAQSSAVAQVSVVPSPSSPTQESPLD